MWRCAPRFPTGNTTASISNSKHWRAYPALVTPDSPTQRVIGAVLDGLTPVRHAVPMLSIQTETDNEATGAIAFDQRAQGAGAG
jgi:NAD-dependent DNA ligase